MPWSNQSGGGGSGGGGGGGWKGGGGGGGGPWGQGPGGPGQQPDLEEFLRRSQDRIKRAMPGNGPSGGLVMLIAAVAIAVLGFFAFTFRVDQDEAGIVMRFGKFERVVEPGLHFRWPAPVEEVLTPKLQRQNITEIGIRTVGAGRGFTGTQRDVPEESLMLTGDENIVDIDFIVRWRISDPKKYLFNLKSPELTVKEVAEAAMREIVGQSKIQPILTEARQRTAQDVHKLIQRVLETYSSDMAIVGVGAGVVIDEVALLKVAPPAQVNDAFLDVQAARADKERLQNEAKAHANRIIPQADGEAKRIMQAAQGFREQTVAEAEGQAKRFLKVYEEYKKAPEVTRKRLYFETMERVLKGSEKIIIDTKGGTAPIPYLPLDQIQRKRDGVN